MIDLKILRSQPGLVRQAIRNKGATVDLDHLLRRDSEQLALQKKVEDMRAERNRLSAAMKAGRPDPMAIAEARALREEPGGYARYSEVGVFGFI
jgi:seryl-tRNA synthetase